MRLSKQPIGAGLVAINFGQRLLIKSRLYLYKSISGPALGDASWRRLSQDISDLPDDVSYSAEDRSELKARYKYYLTMRERQGLKRATAEHIAGSALLISKDSLYRWYTETSTPSAPHEQEGKSKSPYNPPVHHIAAIRDFLIVKGYLSEFELEFDESSLVIAAAINDLSSARITPTAWPEILFSYVSYEMQGSDLFVRRLTFEAFEQTDLILGVLETDSFKPANTSDFGGMLDQAKRTKLKPETAATGWFAKGIKRTLASIFESGHKETIESELVVIKARSTPGNQLKFLSLLRPQSFGEKDGTITPAPRADPEFDFVLSSYDGIVEYYSEKLYNKQGGRSGLEFSGARTFRRTMNSDNTTDLPKRLHELLDACTERGRHETFDEDYEEALRLVNEGVDLSYTSSKNGWNSVHLICGGMLPEFVEVIVMRDDVDFLVRTPRGRLPSDLAFPMSPEHGMMLAKKEAEQAAERGIDLTDILAGAPGANSPG